MKWLLIGLIVIPGAIADVLNAMGMKRNGEVYDFRPCAIFRLIASLARNPYVGVGVPAMAVSFFALMALLSIAKLSFAVPATACSYVLETALAKYILREHIGWRRWAGASLVGCGVLLLVVWLISQLSLLSRVDLSYMLPVTSVSYVLTALMGEFLLHERVSTERWIGIGLVVLGVSLVARTVPRTAPVLYRSRNLPYEAAQ